MSLGLIPREAKVSDRQFVGDLMSLFARHRIEIGDSRSFEHFCSRLASSDAFRSQLFTLCTAISHMSEKDLSGEQLLNLIARGLRGRGDDVGGADIPANVRLEFLSGYDGWGRRDLDAPWPPVRPTLDRDEPLSQQEDEEALAAPSAPETQAAGMRTIQEAIELAQRQSSPNEGGRGTSPFDVNVDGMSLRELTKLLEEIERRMSRIKPQVHDLTPVVPSLVEPPERSTSVPDSSEEVHVAEAAVEAAPQTSTLVVPAVGAVETPVPLQSVYAAEHPRESAFLARHAYLREGRRLPPDTIMPNTSSAFGVALIAPSPVASIASSVVAPVASSVVAPVASSVVAPVASPSVAPIAPTPLGIPAPRVGVFDPNGLTDEDDEFEEPRRMIIVPRSAVSDYELLPRTDRVGFKIPLSVAFIAAILFVGSALAGVVVYHLLHPRARYVEPYQAPAPEVQPSEDMTAPASLEAPDSKPESPDSSQGSAQQGNPPSNSAAAKPQATTDATSLAKAGHPTHNVHPAKPQAPVWPPAPK